MRRLLNLYVCVISLLLVASACSTDDDITDNTTTAGDPTNSSNTTGDPTNDNTTDGNNISSDLADSNSSSDISNSSSTTSNKREVSIDDDDVVRSSRLIQFNDCAELLDGIHTEVAKDVGVYGLENEHIEDNYASNPIPWRAYVENSETNISELNIDEADIIKSDGERIFVLDSTQLLVVDVASRTVTGFTKIAPGWGSKMLLFGDSLLLIQQITKDQYLDTDTAASVELPRSLMDNIITVIQRIEVRNGIPEVLSTLHMEGEYVTSRSVNGIARVVLQSNPMPQFLFVQPLSEAGKSLAEEVNRRVIYETTLEDWLPAYDLNNSGWQLFSACENVHAPSQFSGFGVTTVLTLPVNGEINPDATTMVLAPSDALYASPSSLYTTSTAWTPIPPQTDGDIEDTISKVHKQTTSIHRFDITDPHKATYVSSGGVPGLLHNRFSLSENEGHLRVVTTTENPYTSATNSQIRVLRTEGNQLVEVGRIGNIGQGEQVHSVRFVGDIGFVVISRKIDHSYTIDLSDPTQPIISGRLKIPGFISYLHPINDNYVLGVGSEIHDEGWWIGSKVSLFDVSNLDNPREVGVWTQPDIWNQVGLFQHEFQWHASENLAIFSMEDEGIWLVLLKATDGSITEVGRIKLYANRGQLVGIRVIGTELWTYSWISTKGGKIATWLQVNDLNTLEHLDSIYLDHTTDSGLSNVLFDLDDHVVPTPRLIQFNDCDTLLDHIHTEAASRVGAYGLEGKFVTKANRDADSDDSADGIKTHSDTSSEGDSRISQDSSDSTSDSSREDVEYSETNIQESGVDEADIIKTDGKRIFVVDSDRLVIVDVVSRTVTGSTEIADGWNAEMFLLDDSLLVIQQVKQLLRADSAISEGLTRSLTNTPGTVIQRIEVRNGIPEVVSTLRVEGQYVTSRNINGIARVVLQSNPEQRFPFIYPESEAEELEARRVNGRVVRESTLEDWLPVYDLNNSGWQGFSACENVHAPSQFSDFGVTTVLTLPVDGEIDLDKATAVLAPSDEVYASTTSLYTTITDGEQISLRTESRISGFHNIRGQKTTIHRFDITDSDEATYVSSSEVPGSIHNQFSLSEYDGHLRVVTTQRSRQTGEIESQVRVLRTEGNQLVEVGQVGNIGQGELVQSVRFVGDIGFVVTFHQIDPFYTIDLSDPTKPIIRGELKIPGFSSYLHPINNDYVLGVGSDATDNGQWIGTKVSLFDVSDLDNPREVAVWTEPGTRSAVGEDHRLFLWWAPENLAIIPLHDDWNGALVFKVADGTITEVDRIKLVLSHVQILRTKVIDTEIWSLQSSSNADSAKWLDINDLNTLEYLDSVYLG